jgi:hypothetical protein
MCNDTHRQTIPMYRQTIFLLVLMLTFASCTSFFNEKPIILKEINNNAKTKKAILFLKGGNAVTNDSFHVTVFPSDEKIGDDEIGNVLTAEVRVDSIQLKWMDNDNLEISLPKGTKTFKKETIIEGIKLTYKVIDK